MPTRLRPPHRSTAHLGGFTLVELMVTVSVMAILAMTAVPSFSAMFNRMRVQGTAHELSADLQYARSESVRRRAAVALARDADGLGYTITAAGTPVKAVRFAGGMSMQASSTVTFDPLRSMANASALTLAAGTVALQVSTNAMGRVSICTLTATLKGYPSC